MTIRKKMIEVALPLEVINKESAREKSIRHGHPSTLHLWWARRPLAACRAVLFASLVDDPDSDPAFHRTNGTVDEERAGAKRAELFTLIEDLVRWENSNNTEVLDRARKEIARSIASLKIETGELKKDTVIYGPIKGKTHPKGSVSGEGITAWEVNIGVSKPEIVRAFLQEFAPPVYDPFCGGGSIPLEAQRLGLRAYGSDLNPVAVLITKALIEIPPKFAGREPVNPDYQKKIANEKVAGRSRYVGAAGLAEDVRYYGQWMRDEAEKRIGKFYPKIKVTPEMAKERPDLKNYVNQELTVIAWLWARTVRCPNPACGAIMPLVRSFALSTKKGKEAWVEPLIDRAKKTVEFDVSSGVGTVPNPPKTGRGAKFNCLVCNEMAPDQYLKAEGIAKHLGAKLLAIVAEGSKGRVYLPPDLRHESLAKSALPKWSPEEDLAYDPRNIWCTIYGLTKHRDLFTSRQLLALTTFSDLVQEARERVLADARKAATSDKSFHPTDDKGIADGGLGPTAYADAVATYLAFLIDKQADLGNSLNRWEPVAQCPRQLFARQAIPMVWDFAEGNPLGTSSGSWNVLLDNLMRSFQSPLWSHALANAGQVYQLDAASALIQQIGILVSTDPPYYDNIGYADLSDFFYIWMRRSLGKQYPQIFSTMLVPKTPELVATPYRFTEDQAGTAKEKAEQHFLQGLHKVFHHIRAQSSRDYPVTVYYAFKQTEDDNSNDEEASQSSIASTGWETMLEGLLNSGFALSGTWPVRSEMNSRMVGQGTNALASSVVLVCRARSSNAPMATRKEFVSTLRKELPEALHKLKGGNIAPVDLAQAAIGPGMSVFSQYSKVLEADGSPMTVRTALQIINQELDSYFAESEGEMDPDTRWALAWFEQSGMDEGAYGTAETLSKAKNTSVHGLEEAGILTAKGGKVRLLKRDELPKDWDPVKDTRLTLWETVQHLIHKLEMDGESGASMLVRKLGGAAENARDLAYRLYTICERKKWAQEAMAYNSLVVAWPELTKLAAQDTVMSQESGQLF